MCRSDGGSVSPLVRFLAGSVVACAVGIGFWWLIHDDGDVPVQGAASRGATADRVVDDAPPVAEPIRGGDERAPVATAPIAPERAGPGVIRGCVYHSSGEPAGGAAVTARYLHWKLHEAPPSARLEVSVTSNPHGRFDVDRLPIGDWGLVAVLEDRSAVATLRLEESEPSGEVTLELGPSGRIAGVVKNGAGRPVAGAAIYPQAERNSDWTDPMRARALAGTTGERGEFAIAPLDAGRWRLLVRAPGYAAHVSDWIATGTQDVEVVLAAGVRVSGIVVRHADGEPAVAVNLHLVTPSMPLDQMRAESDAAGRFSFADVRAESWRLGLDSPTLVVAEEALPVAVTEGKDIDGLRVVVAPGAVVRGRVYDKESGQGIAGARIHAAMDGPHLPPDGREATSGTDGSYRIEGLPAGGCRVTRWQTKGYPQGQGNDGIAINADLAAEIDDVDFAVVRGIGLRGRVVTEELQEPIAGAMVSAWADGGGGGWQQVRADGEGKFELMGFKAGQKLSVQPSSRGWAAAVREPIALTGEVQEGIVLSMFPEASIEGSVVDAAGKPLSGVRVSCAAEAGWRFGMESPLSDSDGGFRIGQLVAGAYNLSTRDAKVQIWSQGARPDDTRIELAKSEARTGVRLVYAPGTGLAIAGGVTNAEGDPVAGVSISVNGGSERGWMSGHVSSDEEGKFRIDGLEPGNYFLNVHHANYGDVHRQNVRAGDEAVAITLRKRGLVAGRVVDALENAPIERFEILHTQGSVDALQPWMQSNFTRFRDHAGRFRLSTLQPGENTIVVRAEGYSERFVKGVQVSEDGEAEELLVALEPGIPVEGVVVGPSGEPIEGALVFVGPVPHAWARAGATAATTDLDGRFQLSSLSENAEQISAHHANYASGSVTLARGAARAPVRIVLPRGGKVAGTIRVGGVPAEQAWVSCSSVEQPESGESSQVTGGEGRYQVDGIAPGTVLVTASTAGTEGMWRSLRKTVEVAAGSAQTLDFDFGASDARLEGRVLNLEEGQGQGYLSLTLESEHGTESFHSQMQADGTFRFASLPAGKGVLKVTFGGEGFREQSVEVLLASGEITQKDIELSAGAVIRGVVKGIEGCKFTAAAALRGKHEIKQITPMVFLALETQVAATMQVKEDGAYRIGGLEPGEYTLVVVAFDENPQGLEALAKGRLATEVVKLEAEEVREIDLEVPAR